MAPPTDILLADADPDRIRSLFLQMCVRSETMVRLAVRSVLDRDPNLGRSIVSADRELDRLEVEIDRRCMALLTLRLPVDRDLRWVTAIMKMVTDLERIGDLAVNIAERGLELANGFGMEPGSELPEMAVTAADMIRMAAHAFVDADAALAREVMERDREVDEHNRRAFGRLLGAIAAHPDQADRALCLISISKHVERVGDHAKNLAEMIVFVVEGSDVRHNG